ncbi:uncharacterized protein HD556DRAFT_1452289 [Suillus plorans]|uniref:Uncharacterized protein n=1 Tax=Suillus plorans TaxID=116603 RepID=A0A9P7J9F8_9AGAM|nr:uncharacterized protein HD556DRAFT_1452289 [Suillus plorans]KAG1809838.1 hypothetical protein HD556DRAFT_1452289 [Suillus plorans]
MSRPQTHPTNANKHPGQIVQDANKVQRQSKEESCTAIAAVEDAMAIQQNAQAMGPPRLVRPQPKPRMVVGGKNSINLENKAVTAESDVDLDDEEHYEPPAAQGRQDLVHFMERPRDASRGDKRSLQTLEEADYTDLEGLELLEDPEAAEDGDELYIDNAAMMVDDNGRTDQKAKVIETRCTSSMSVGISDSKTTNARIKPEDAVPENHHAKIRKGKAKNSDLSSRVLEQGQWRTVFLPSLMYWVGNDNNGWSIPESELESALEDVYYAVYPRSRRGHCEFLTDGFPFQLVSQRIHEWRAAFGSTAVSVLMAFFASTPEYETQEAREEYTKYQLQDCCFIYEDPKNEEQPGTFLSEYILCTFASHLTAISGRVRVDALVQFGKPGYLTVLVLAAAAAEHALLLVKDHLLIDSDPSDNGGKGHKILQTLNEATNKMSHTGTAFSSGNWETDTKAYMESVKDLPYSRIQEILTCAEEYMKHPRHNCLSRSGVDESCDSSQSIAPANKRARLRICNFILFVFLFVCVKNMLKGRIRRAWLQLVRCAPYPSMCPLLPRAVERCPKVTGRCPEGIGQCPESDVRCVGIPADVWEQEIRLIWTKSKLERKQRRTTRGRGGGDKSIGIDPKTSGGRRERNSSRTEEGMSRV